MQIDGEAAAQSLQLFVVALQQKFLSLFKNLVAEQLEHCNLVAESQEVQSTTGV